MRAGWLIACGLALGSCGGSEPPTPTTPSTPPASASVRGILTRTVEGGSAAGATLSAGGMTARSAADGSFALDLPAGEHRITVSGPGIVERTTTIRAPNGTLALDAIPTGGPWTLGFYRELARNGAGGGELEPLIPWDSEPTFFIDARPEPTTGAEIPTETIDFVREAIRITVPLLSAGRYRGERIEVTREPPAAVAPGPASRRADAEGLPRDVDWFSPLYTCNAADEAASVGLRRGVGGVRVLYTS